MDLADLGGTYGGSMTAFERRLQELEADTFVAYLNGLGLTDAEGNLLTLTGLRSGTYYDAILGNISDALNATEIMLGADGHSAVDPAKYWRIRSGTADQHTSFSIGFNIGLASRSLGLDVDYHLVWNMGHGSNEGTSTGTFIDWINAICAE